MCNKVNFLVISICFLWQAVCLGASDSLANTLRVPVNSTDAAGRQQKTQEQVAQKAEIKKFENKLNSLRKRLENLQNTERSLEGREVNRLDDKESISRIESSLETIAINIGRVNKEIVDLQTKIHRLNRPVVRESARVQIMVEQDDYVDIGRMFDENVEEDREDLAIPVIGAKYYLWTGTELKYFKGNEEAGIDKVDEAYKEEVSKLRSFSPGHGPYYIIAYIPHFSSNYSWRKERALYDRNHTAFKIKGRETYVTRSGNKLIVPIGLIMFKPHIARANIAYEEASFEAKLAGESGNEQHKAGLEAEKKILIDMRNDLVQKAENIRHQKHPRLLIRTYIPYLIDYLPEHEKRVFGEVDTAIKEIEGQLERDFIVLEGTPRISI